MQQIRDIKMLPTKIVMSVFILILIGSLLLFCFLLRQLINNGCTAYNAAEKLINIFPYIYVKNEEINKLFNISPHSKIYFQDLFNELVNEAEQIYKNDFIFKNIIDKKLIDPSNSNILTDMYYKYCMAFLKNEELFSGASELTTQKATIFINKFNEFNKLNDNGKEIQQLAVYEILVTTTILASLAIAIFCALRIAFFGPEPYFHLCSSSKQHQEKI